MEEKEILASNLTKFRKNAGLSQLELAKQLNYSNKNISKWENGETMPNAFVLAKIAKLYGVKIEDLLSQSGAEQIETTKEHSKNLQKRKFIFRLTMLLLANAIMYAVGTALLYGLHLGGIKSFNIWLVYLYLTPFTFLSIVIFVRVLYKFVEMISLSMFGWLICISIYLSLLSVNKIEFIFALGAAYQVIAVCIALLVNIKIRNSDGKVKPEKRQRKTKLEKSKLGGRKKNKQPPYNNYVISKRYELGHRMFKRFDINKVIIVQKFGLLQ